MKHKQMIDFEEGEISVQELLQQYWDTNMPPSAVISFNMVTHSVTVTWEENE